MISLDGCFSHRQTQLVVVVVVVVVEQVLPSVVAAVVCVSNRF